MKLIIRLYKQHDMDLISLHLNKEFSIRKATKLAIISYVRKEPYRIETPKGISLPQKMKTVYTIHVTLNEDFDFDIIDWIKGIKDRYRNSTIKNMIRGYLDCPIIYPYLKDKESIDENEAIKDVFLEKRPKYKNFTKRKDSYIPERNSYREKVEEVQQEIKTMVPYETVPKKIVNERLENDKQEQIAWTPSFLAPKEKKEESSTIIINQETISTSLDKEENIDSSLSAEEKGHPIQESVPIKENEREQSFESTNSDDIDIFSLADSF